MGRPKITRKGYTRDRHWRKPYTRKDGTEVKGAWVERTTVPETKIKDIGAKGKGKKVVPIKPGKLTKYGYSISKPAKVRRAALRKAAKRYGARKVWYMLHGMVVMRSGKGKPRTGRRATERKKFEADRNWVKKTLKPKLGRYG